MRQDLLVKLDKVQQIARATKWSRLVHDPLKYVYAISFLRLIYPISKKEKLKQTPTFFGEKMTVALPASTDIYLTKGKSHDSEIRLAKFLILTLNEGDTFLDIGAHYGYFSLLASEVVSKKGRVFSYEPSNSTFKILKSNVENNKHKNIECFQQAISDNNGELTFFEFPNLYSEYNSMDVNQFDQEKWYSKYKPQKITVHAKTIDTIVGERTCRPAIIKIDVEGAEYKVISGAKQYLQDHSPYIAMEYVCEKRSNAEHVRALQLLKDYNYRSFYINSEGELTELSDIEAYLTQKKIESDNIIFKKG